MTRITLGSGDNPFEITAIGLEQCSDGHPNVVFPNILILKGSGATRGECPACAGAAAARAEHLERTADELPDDPLHEIVRQHYAGKDVRLAPDDPSPSPYTQLRYQCPFCEARGEHPQVRLDDPAVHCRACNCWFDRLDRYLVGDGT